MEYIHFSFLAWLALIIAGLPICLVGLPSDLRRYSLLFAPLFGFCYLAFTSYYLFRLNVGGTDTYSLSLFLLPVLALVGLIAWRERSRGDLLSAFNREAVWVTMLLLAAFAIVSAPLMAASAGRALATSMSNLDVVEYSIGSRYLQEFVPATQEGFFGQTAHLKAFCTSNWFGPMAIVAIMCSLLHAEPYQLQILVMDIIAVQAVAFVYLLAKEILGFGRLGSSLLALLYALSPVPLYVLWQSFGGQGFAMALMLALFLIQSHSLKSGFLRARSWSHLPATVILLTGMLLSYHYMVAVGGVFLGSYLICHGCFSRQWREAWHAGWFLAGAYAICFALNLWRTGAAASELAIVQGAQAGWFIPWLTPDVIGGANAAAIFAGIGDQGSRVFWAIAASVPFLLTTWHVLRSSPSVGVRSFFIGLALPALLLGCLFAWLGMQNGVLGGYRSFKITASFSALSILGGAIAFAGCSWKRHRGLTLVAGVTFTAFASVAAINVWHLARFTREHAFVPGPELVALKRIEHMPFVKGINVMDADNSSLLWTNYFTLRTRQVYQRFPYGGRPVGLLNQEFSLAKDVAAARAVGHSEDVFSVESSDFEVEYPISAWYTLYKAQENRDVTITPGEGWYGLEATHRWSGSTGSVCSVYIDSKMPDILVHIEASFFLPLGDTDSISATFNGAPLKLTHNRTGLRSEACRLNASRNVVEFRSSLPPGTPSTRDPRTLGIAWASVIVKFASPVQSNQNQSSPIGHFGPVALNANCVCHHHSSSQHRSFATRLKPPLRAWHPVTMGLASVGR